MDAAKNLRFELHIELKKLYRDTVLLRESKVDPHQVDQTIDQFQEGTFDRLNLAQNEQIQGASLMADLDLRRQRHPPDTVETAGNRAAEILADRTEAITIINDSFGELRYDVDQQLRNVEKSIEPSLPLEAAQKPKPAEAHVPKLAGELTPELISERKNAINQQRQVENASKLKR